MCGSGDYEGLEQLNENGGCDEEKVHGDDEYQDEGDAVEFGTSHSVSDVAAVAAVIGKPSRLVPASATAPPAVEVSSHGHHETYVAEKEYEEGQDACQYGVDGVIGDT